MNSSKESRDTARVLQVTSQIMAMWQQSYGTNDKSIEINPIETTMQLIDSLEDLPQDFVDGLLESEGVFDILRRIARPGWLWEKGTGNEP